MANIKTGFDFYQVNTDRYLDMKIKRLRHQFSCAGIAVYDYFLAAIYRDKGCYLDLTPEHFFDCADYFKIEEKQVLTIVDFCREIGLFYPKEVLKNMLSSKSIVTRYLFMSKNAKRKKVNIPEELTKLPEVWQIIQEEYIDYSGILPHNITIDNNNNIIPEDCNIPEVCPEPLKNETPTTPKTTKSVPERKKDFANNLAPFSKKNGGKFETELITKFYDYWTETNKSGKKMRFENQTHFEIPKRLARFLLNQQNFNNNQKIAENDRDDKIKKEFEAATY